MPKRKTTEEFIMQSQKIYGDKYSYRNTVYKGNDVRILITCPYHGDVEVLPQKHTGIRREECKYCKGYVPKEPISQDYLKKWFIYDPISGDIHNKGNHQKMGSWDNGYIRMGIHGERFMNHRVAYLYMTGEYPELIQHINNDRKDNSWINLEKATWSEINLNK